MPRRARVPPGGLVYHVLNQLVAGLPLFRREADYEAFERIMIEAQQRHPTGARLVLDLGVETGTQLVLTAGSAFCSFSVMPRRARVAPGGLVCHVLNRSVAGLPLFRKEADYEAFERIMIEAQQRHPTRVLAWCWMRNIGTS